MIDLLTDSVEPGARSLPHGRKTLVLRLTAAHGYLDRRRRERPVRETRQRRDYASPGHLHRQPRRRGDRKSVDVKMVLVAAVNDRTNVGDAYEPYALGGAALYEVGAGVYQL